MRSISCSTSDAQTMSQGETSQAEKIYPSEAPRTKGDFYSLEGNQGLIPGVKRLVGTHPSPGLPLQSNLDFDAIAFTDQLFSFPRNSPSDYQALTAMSLPNCQLYWRSD
ncbi:unnamed protein product [Vicia faba]|uniref:Uncharacterized protein n=1 Tax=Vicia faba TaxID=3906 RepID=A0AAV0ZG32_VICFA|nr:unnamed protein product [Vicia faba]